MSLDPIKEENPTSEPTIQVDSDWKAEAQAEKERLLAAEKKVEDRAEARQIPEASFRGLMSILASQALMGLGAQQDPSGKGVMVDLEGSKFSIDLLVMIEEKTKGNLTEEETTELKQLIQELQSRFVQIAKLISEQPNQGGVSAVAQDGQPTTGGIIDPTA